MLSYKRLYPERDQDLSPPSYASTDAAGLDLRASKTLQLLPMKRILVPTGLAFEIPVGYEGQLRPRSGFAYRHGITVLNSPGTIDADYRGEVHVLLINLGEMPFTIKRGDRIAQLVISPICRISLCQQDDLAVTERGNGGFGSTGHQ